ncbi:hypothetical protein OIE52_19495 [Streptomyces canus]|uniref:hypothetical protein n=1 Tax=Streptomyces canus TaxID=58343 RepID=UPI00324A8ECF
MHQREFALQGGADVVSATLWPLSVDGLLLLATVGLLNSPPHAGSAPTMPARSPRRPRRRSTCRWSTRRVTAHAIRCPARFAPSEVQR